MKSILLPLTANISGETATKIASKLAKDYSATLTALFIKQDPRLAIPFMGEGLSAEMVQTICDAAEQETRTQAQKAKSAFTEQMSAASIPITSSHNADKGAKALWKEMVGTITDHVGRRARTADLAVCEQPDSNAPDSADILHDLVFRSGRSVLMVPQKYEGESGKHIMIAWNGRAEIARAVTGALPLLKKAGKITIYQLGDIDDDRPSLEDINTYLHEHGISCSTEKGKVGDNNIGEQLLNAAKEQQADMMIIGAYSHSRWRELILGGATRWLVLNSTIPLFMSH